jgi:hypothetical protein
VPEFQSILKPDVVEACPICGEVITGGDTFSMLARHILNSHIDSTKCWCGVQIILITRTMTEDSKFFKKHCGEHGGYLAHYLEHQLGVSSE